MFMSHITEQLVSRRLTVLGICDNAGKVGLSKLYRVNN